MGRVEAFVVEGLVLRFYSNDHHPAHFHAEKPGHGEVRVFFMREPPEIEAVWGTLPNKVIRRLRASASRFRIALLKEWERKVSSGSQGGVS